MKNKRHQNHTNPTTANNKSNVLMAVAQVCIAIGNAIADYYSEKR